MVQPLSSEVFTAGEIARAAGVPTREVLGFLETGRIRPLRGTAFVGGADAVRICRALAARQGASRPSAPGLFALANRSSARPRTGLPAVASSAVHALLLGIALWFSAGAANIAYSDNGDHEPARLVFIVSRGPGGGGGGGGLRNPLPAPKLLRRAIERPRPSVPEVKPPEPAPTPVEREPDPPPAPPIVAPVVPVAASAEDRQGVIDKAKEAPASQDSGIGAGVGKTQGVGNGDGMGSGIGEGAGGGTGGGPYRPGSGVTPPRLLREVKADYTDEARRRGISGNVLMEIVVRRDGSVGDVTVLRGLGAGLEQRAIAAVHQWRFDPARLRGTPVDVIVQVSVEFTLR
jgi:TonB family protein